MRSIRNLLSCLLLFGFLVGCGLLDENGGNEDSNNSPPAVQIPRIISFEGEATTHSEEGRVVTLVWEVSGTDPELSISPAPGTVTGTSITLPLGETTTYTLTATNSAGTNSKSVTVNTDDQLAPPDDGDEPPAPPNEDPDPPSEPLEPLNLTGTWRLTAPTTIYNDCPLDWLFELSQDESGVVLTGSYDYGRDDPNASDPLLTCSGSPNGIFDPAFEGSVSDDGTITLRGDYIYGADYTGAPPEDEDRIVLKAASTDADTLAVTLEVISTGGGSTPFTIAATMKRVDNEPDLPAD